MNRVKWSTGDRESEGQGSIDRLIGRSIVCPLTHTTVQGSHKTPRLTSPLPSPFQSKSKSPRNQVRMALAEQRVEMVLTLLGLTGCQDTIVGNATTRGVRCVVSPFFSHPPVRLSVH
jgi:hypothetical protein